MINFLFSVSTWLEYDTNTIQKYIDNSFNIPIFILYFSPYCPYCHGLPEGFKNYSSGLGNRSDIYIMTIDCTKTDGCRRFHVRGTPTIVLVRGNNYKYWPHTRERGPEGWDRWINETLAPNLQEIHNDTELEAAKSKPRNGGSSFIIEVPSKEDSYLGYIKNISRIYRIFDDWFFYRVNHSINETRVTAYQVENCPIPLEGKVSYSESFFKQYRFGSLHEYELDELMDVTLNSPVVLYVVNDEISDSEKHQLRILSGFNCNGIQYGWIKADEYKDIHKYSGTGPIDLPFLFGYKRKNGCKFVWKKKISLASPLVESHLISGRCGSSGNFDGVPSIKGIDRLFFLFAGVSIIGFVFFRGLIMTKITSSRKDLFV